MQCGVFSRRQALTAGAVGSLMQRRVRSGHWTLVVPGVFALPGHPPSFRRGLWIAWLAAPACAVVSHWSAGHLQRLPGFPPNRIALTVPHGATHRHPTARVFQTAAPPVPLIIEGLP